MSDKNTIAGVAVLYNPQSNVISNISSYIDQVGTLFVIDNSDNPTEEFINTIKAFRNALYIRIGKNVGLAAALNLGSAKALEQGYDFLLTMDQDSKAAPDMVSSLLECLKQDDPEKVAIVSPFHVTKNVPPPKERTCKEVRTVMTSGNLLNLKIYREVGPFMDDLFIDYVDHDYCLRLRQKGYRVLQTSSTLLEHGLGDIKAYNFVIGKLGATNHSPLRRYFMTRNRFYVMRKYGKEEPGYYWSQLKAFFVELLTIIIFEDQKGKKLRAVAKGYRDYRNGILGYPKQQI